MDWSSPHPCGVINVATRYCLMAGEGGDAMCHVAGGSGGVALEATE